ncbi:hypothetical protein L2E82_00129 [Cichorium intybus]|uniref:Uncharacterized protein n=1 Tax=Cichorium intybus TaxID=13427 RepID=A0ACB9GXQ0_CICIN|nr:hypothetical protein L2E82_00129 [Cichorium intybus]
MHDESKTDDNFGSLGICHRLFNFIINSFLIRRFTSPHGYRSQAHEDNNQDHDLISHHGHDTGPEIQVEFRHINGSTANRRNNGSDNILVQENGNTTLTRRKTDSQDQRNGNGDRENVQKKTSLTIIDGEKLPGRKHHLLNVASNINEKADDFIRSRKEAMEKKLINDM